MYPSITSITPHISVLRKRNTWYTMADGNWNDPHIWLSNGTKRNAVPQTGDDVYVNHTVDYSNNFSGSGFTFNNSINNLLE